MSLFRVDEQCIQKLQIMYLFSAKYALAKAPEHLQQTMASVTGPIYVQP
jgi:hypothetical protein